MIKKMIDETVFPKESKNVSVGSGIIQSSRYLITISSNAGCMDFGFIVGGEEPLSSKGIFTWTALTLSESESEILDLQMI